jgi:hypothetical protein
MTSPVADRLGQVDREYIRTEGLAGRFDIASIWILTALVESADGVLTLPELAEQIGLPLELTREAMIRLADRGTIQDAAEPAPTDDDEHTCSAQAS